MAGISKDDKNNYICHECGSTWSGADKWLLWPPKLSLARRFSVCRYGIETEPDGAGRRVFRTVLHLGWLRIVLGKGYKSKVKWNVNHQCWIPQSQYMKVEQDIDNFIENIVK